LTYTVELQPGVKRQIERLSLPNRRRLDAVLQKLAQNPRHRGVRRVKAKPGTLRDRFGNHRVLFTVDDERHVVTVTRVAIRDKAY